MTKNLVYELIFSGFKKKDALSSVPGSFIETASIKQIGTDSKGILSVKIKIGFNGAGGKHSPGFYVIEELINVKPGVLWSGHR